MKEFQRFLSTFETIKDYLHGKDKLIVVLCTRGEDSLIYTREETTYKTWYEHFKPIKEFKKVRYNDLCKRLSKLPSDPNAPILEAFIDTYRLSEFPVEIVEYCGVPELFYYYDLVKEENGN